MTNVELLLVDGPGAGQYFQVDKFALRFSWRDPAALFSPLDLIGTYVSDAADVLVLQSWTPPTTEYRIMPIRGWDREIMRIGWCEGEHPDPAAVGRWMSALRPVKVIGRGPELSYDCDYAWRSDPVTGRIQGDCACGWRTEEMPSRYARSVLKLVEQHRTESQNALDEHLRGLDPNGDISEQDRKLLAVIRLVKWAEEDPEVRIPVAVSLVFGPQLP